MDQQHDLDGIYGSEVSIKISLVWEPTVQICVPYSFIFSIKPLWSVSFHVHNIYPLLVNSGSQFVELEAST